MPVQIVNPVGAEEITAWASSMSVTFLGDPRDADVPRRHAMLRSLWDPGRAWGARDGDRWVATLRTEPRTLTVPGPGTTTALVDIDAVTNVTVAATHTRRGLLREMLGASLAAAHARGDVLSALIAAEWPIYGRFGYAPATLSADYTLRRMLPGSRVAGEPGRVRPVQRDEFARVAPAVFAAARRHRAGQIDRAGTWYGRQLGEGEFAPSPSLPVNLMVHDGDDGPDGVLGWTPEPGGHFSLIPPFLPLAASWFSAATDRAYRDLWAYLTAIDLVSEITLKDRPVDEPVRWLLPDARTLVTTELNDFLWIRLLDVPGALSARGYATAGELVIDVQDEDVGGATSGRYRVQAAEDGSGACERTPAAPDLTLGQRTLASLYLGAFTPAQLRLAGQIGEHVPGAVNRLTAMFATPLAPWCGTWF
ncbi:MAG TPA: GNAT family N-acetyltransferase [Solirubrobacteraceae bacterium]|nr:GNAT family N-acetyltransferase [Solirubrobacteraceae bacterium]